MGYKRAEWHSGLTYQQTCRECNSIVQYTDYQLDFRPWFADGFVYCPNCNTPLRHGEQFAINGPTPPTSVVQQPAPAPTPAPAPAPAEPSGASAFCPQCGKQFNPDDRFCSGCGTKRG